jgi:hypothetical protein
MRRRVRDSIAVILIALALGSSGCEEQPGFMEPTKVRETFMDLDDQVVLGQNRIEFRVNVPSGVTHPSFEGLWTFRNPEKPLWVYVVRSADYTDSNADPATLPNYFMLDPVVTTIHVHPTPGDWVVLLINPADFGPTTASEVSGSISLSYWR